MNRKVNMKMAIIIVTLIVSYIVCGYFFLYKPHMMENMMEKKLAIEQEKVWPENDIADEQAAQMAKIAAEQAAKLAKMQELATFKNGDGPERVFIRQLVYSPDLMNGVKVKIGKKEYDLAFKGDQNDKKAVKKWAGKKANLLAIFFGYVDRKNGRQIRFKNPGKFACVIDVNDSKTKLSADIYKKETVAEFSSNIVASTNWLAAADGQHTFWADVKDGISSFEYVWTPEKVKKHKKQKK